MIRGSSSGWALVLGVAFAAPHLFAAASEPDPTALVPSVAEITTADAAVPPAAPPVDPNADAVVATDGVPAAPTAPIPAAPRPAAPPRKPAPPAFPTPKTLPPIGPYKLLYFENDFSYKKDPNHAYIFGEELKNMTTEIYGEQLTISTGGEIRHRFMHEDNRLRPGGGVFDTDYNLWRWRHYIDAKYGDVRVYFEGIEADSFGSEAPDQAIDANRWDIQNLFIDLTLLEDELGTHTIRYGRQELLFGRQRLVSPLDWANTRRNFEGARYTITGDNYKLDGFAVHPVNSATGFNAVADRDSQFDQPNYSVWFAGTYYSYTGYKNTVIDAYWLMLDTQRYDPARPDGNRHLLGTHWAQLHPITDGCGNELRVWDLDAEGGFQLGTDNRETVIAGFLTGVVGHTWKKAYWTPRLSGLFYYGSGDREPLSGQNNTFNTLFPLGHAYWGISDNLTGQNLYDYCVQVDMRPTKKMAVTSAMHWFALASNGDTLYNVAGIPVGTPGNGRDVGQALDLYGYYSFNPNFDVQLGYSWFWYGQYLEATTPRGDGTQFYVQTSFRY